ncbi:MAG: RNA polymerase sigma factor [Vicinamibacteria bacterium]
MSSDIARTIDVIWRMESAKVIAVAARIVRDVGLAEDVAQDALVAALEQWPRAGIPANPGAWLTTAAKRRAVDVVRHRAMASRKHDQIRHEAGPAEPATASPDEAAGDDVGDDLLPLIFTACHPVLATDARIALTLRLLGGLTTAEIARAFLAAEPTIAQRIVRAKRTLTNAGVPFEVPDGAERAARLSSVLDVLYLIFNEGYAATAGDDWMRPALCEDAMRLGRVLAGLMPDEAEVHGLVALMELHASRLRARAGADGAPVLLADQNRAAWDRLLIQRGLAGLARAERLSGDAPGPYTLQAAIAACHARAVTADATDWPRIVGLYTALVRATGSPVVELNRAVAVGMAFGPEAGLEAMDALTDELALADYAYLPAARGEMLERLGRGDEAAAEFRRAAELTRNARERALLQARAASSLRAASGDARSDSLER